MTRAEKDKIREERIHMEIVVDTYGPEEQAMGWYSYLDDVLQFPCTAQRIISPLQVGDEVEVLDMATAEECEHEMFVVIRWDREEGLGVPLSQLKAIDAGDEETQQAVADWRYWVGRGYQF